ncbi:MAG: hypothetical protein HRU11_02890 [Parvularculaceae bacterium]|nr:hypothetical protein [Parvularculaceae bacterium]
MSQNNVRHLNPSDQKGLISLGILLAIVLVMVFLTGPAEDDGFGTTLVESRSLIFEESRAVSGSVNVINADTMEPLLTLTSGEGGFTRTALRALAYNRRLHDVAPNVPLILGKTDKGRIFIIDPSTDKSIAVSSFGQSNADQLQSLLSAPNTSS